MEHGGAQAPPPPMAVRKRAARVTATDLASAEPRVNGVRVVRILQPVWLLTHKAARGEVVALDVQLAERMVKNLQAEFYDAGNS